MKTKTNTRITKNFFFTIIIFSFLLLAWSCDKNEDYDDNGIMIPKGWAKNKDLELLGKNDWYLYRSGNDSIKLKFHYYRDGIISYTSYKKNKNGSHSHINHASLYKAQSITKSNQKQILGIDYKEQDFRTEYEMVNNSTIIMYGLPELNIAGGGYEFKAVTEKTYFDKSRLIGGWYNTGVVDSTVLVFDDEIVKEFLFVKKTSALVNSGNSGKYRTTCTDSFIQNELFATQNKLLFYEFIEDNPIYSLDENKLTIEWKSPRTTTTYTRLKK